MSYRDYCCGNNPYYKKKVPGAVYNDPFGYVPKDARTTRFFSEELAVAERFTAPENIAEKGCCRHCGKYDDCNCYPYQPYDPKLSLNDLCDVRIRKPREDQVLMYDECKRKWVNRDLFGLQGPEGPEGQQGQQGEQGQQGPAGVQGPDGEQGETGPQGAEGNQGTQGANGTQGDVGPQGANGLQGPLGPQGIEGPSGEPGGPQGPPGPQGIQGTAGTPGGPQGVQGPAGDTGSQGLQGSTGSAGPQGFQGDAGPQGSQGNDGPAGAQGSAGPQGQQGNVGANGPQGFQGNSGPQGQQGNTGSNGPQGLQGNSGAQGGLGPQGLQGNTGSNGPQGPQGAAGTPVDLGALSDVEILPPLSTDQVLLWDGTIWRNQRLRLNTLQDVDPLLNPILGSTLYFNGESWTTTGPAPNQGSLLQFNGVSWTSLPAENIQPGDVLTWDGQSWVPAPPLAAAAAAPISLSTDQGINVEPSDALGAKGLRIPNMDDNSDNQHFPSENWYMPPFYFPPSSFHYNTQQSPQQELSSRGLGQPWPQSVTLELASHDWSSVTTVPRDGTLLSLHVLLERSSAKLNAFSKGVTLVATRTRIQNLTEVSGQKDLIQWTYSLPIQLASTPLALPQASQGRVGYQLKLSNEDKEILEAKEGDLLSAKLISVQHGELKKVTVSFQLE